jgi:hypothetical protein
MSVKVDLAELAEHLQHYGLAYLLTVGDDSRPHAVATHPTFEGRTLDVGGVGRQTRANLEARPDVTLLWPPFEHGGYSLIVDGHVTLDGDRAALEPRHAILHRTAADGTGHDCVPVDAS